MIHESYKAPTELVQEYRKKLEYSHRGSERPRRGHLIFEFEFDTGLLRIITPKKEDISKTTTPVVFESGVDLGVPIEGTTTHIKIHRKEGCLYFCRLNYKSAFRYLAKIMPGVTFDLNT